MMKLSSELKFKVNNNDIRTRPKEVIPPSLLLTLKKILIHSVIRATTQSLSNVQVTYSGISIVNWSMSLSGR